MATLTKLQLLHGNHKVVPVDIPDMEGDLFIKPISGRARDTLELMYERFNKGDTDAILGIRAFIVQASLCDENGVLLFDVEDIDSINESLPAILIDKLVDQAKRVSGLGENSQESVEQAVKN